MGNTEKYFISNELYAEISVSVGAAATAIMDEYSGIVNNFAFCLPHRTGNRRGVVSIGKGKKIPGHIH